MHKKAIVLTSWMLALPLACVETNSACQDGSQNCPCTEEGTCQAGLLCQQSLCMTPPPWTKQASPAPTPASPMQALISDCNHDSLICLGPSLAEPVPTKSRVLLQHDQCVLYVPHVVTVLVSDGTAIDNSHTPMSWTIDENGTLCIFNVSGDNSCTYLCELDGVLDVPCGDSPSSCTAQPLETCERVEGCFLDKKKCTGVPKTCPYYISRSACEEQGCTWYGWW